MPRVNTTPPSRTNQQPFPYVWLSTVDDFSYIPSAQEKSRDAAQIAATGRRSWKTLKGKGEAVWPPQLEAALIEGLEKYRPDATRSTKSVGRFPMRNRFISDYIFEITGKRRTPKQVGSRLQQLRDTCKGKKLLDLISNRNKADGESQSPSPPSSSDNSLPDTPFRPPTQVRPDRVVIHVDIPPTSLPWPSPFPIVHPSPDGTTPLNIHFTSHHPCPTTIGLSAESADLTGALPSAPCLPSHSVPVMSFSSPSVLHPQATFSVYLDRGGLPVHKEVVPLICCTSPLQGCEWVYRASLVPGLWQQLCNCEDPSRYTIVQDIIPVDHQSPDEKTSSSDISPMYSIVFSFIDLRVGATSMASLPSQHIQGVSDVDAHWSDVKRESPVSSFSPVSSSGSLQHQPLAIQFSTDTRQPADWGQETWTQAPQYPVVSYPNQSESQYPPYDNMFPSFTQNHPSANVPLISKMGRNATATGPLAAGTNIGWQTSDKAHPAVLFSPLALPLVRHENYVL